MSSPKKGLFDEVGLRRAESMVGGLRPGDGVDPRELAKRKRREHRLERGGESHGSHKQEQLYAQVQQAIDGALQAAATPILNQLTVREVAQQGGSLMVVLEAQELSSPEELAEANAAVEHAGSMLRREVAGAITRKEVPHLNFMILPPGSTRLED